MGSHYIQVGKLKVDSALLDIVCPAAGYDTTPPNPAIYCPANGYTQPVVPWTPPVEITTPGTDQILLLVDDLEQGVFSFYCKANSGNVLCEILTVDMVSLSSVASATTHSFSLPTIDLSALYVIRLRPQTAGTYITHFYRTTYSGYNTNYRVLHAKFDTPSITTLASAFDGMLAIKKCEFLSNMNSLTTMVYAFRNTTIESVTFPEQMNALQTVAQLFRGTTALKICDLTNFPMAATLTDMSYLIAESSVEQLIFPADLVNVTTCFNLATTCPLLTSVTMFSTADSLSIISSMFNKCTKLAQSIKFPPLPALTDAGYVAQYSGIIKLEFEGASDLCTTMRDGIGSCPNIEEFIMPSSMNSVTNVGVYQMWLSSLKIKRVVLPTAMPLLTSPPNPTNFINTTNINQIYEITECSNWGTSKFAVVFYSTKLLTFYQPLLRVSNMTFGQSTARSVISSIEVDWANSLFVAGNAIFIYSSTMNSTELDRIFTALPAVAAGYSTMQIKAPGWATCTPAIATGKGWTVSGAI